MGKVKLAKKIDTGEQVSFLRPWRRIWSLREVHHVRLPSRSYLDRRQMMAAALGKENVKIIPRRFALHVKLRSFPCWIILTYVACETSYELITTGICSSNM